MLATVLPELKKGSAVPAKPRQPHRPFMTPRGVRPLRTLTADLTEFCPSCGAIPAGSRHHMAPYQLLSQGRRAARLQLQVGEGCEHSFFSPVARGAPPAWRFCSLLMCKLAWSKWRSILLDNTVQHVDDFRTVHLAEVLAQFVADGRQIICAVEDPALADLLCRRLPVRRQGDAKRVTLGPPGDGSSAKLHETDLMPLARRVIVVTPRLSAAS